MKKLLMIIALICMSLSVSAKDIKTAVFTTKPGISCNNCVKRIQENLRFAKGVKMVEASVEEQTVTITYDADKTSTDAIVEAFKKIDYVAEVATPCGSKKEGCSRDCCGKDKEQKEGCEKHGDKNDDCCSKQEKK